MQLRSRRVQVPIDANDGELPDAELSTLSIADDPDEFGREEDLSQMEVCLQTLPSEQRTCLTLFYLERKSYTEVADLTGYDLKQVKSYLQNGRRMLKLCMKK